MIKKNLLEESLADAKLIKQAALENAKIAIHESLTPHIMSSLSTRIQEMDEEEIKEEELDLDEILSELEGSESKDLKEDETEEEVEGEEVEDLDLENMTPEDLKTLIGDVVDEMIEGGEIEAGPNAETEEVGAEEPVTEEEEVDIDELLKEVEEVEEGKKKEVKSSKELMEAHKVIRMLRKQMNEQNILNTRLIYATKLLRSKTLSESQVGTILESFDKAKSVDQIKLIYETLNKGLNKPKNSKKTIKEAIKKGSASKSIIASNLKTNIKPIIEDSTFTRMQELAGV